MSYQNNRRKNRGSDASHLLNFQTYETPPKLASSLHFSGQRKKHEKQQRQKEKLEIQEEKHARNILQGYFFLHSSASHAFVITRRRLLSNNIGLSSCEIENYGGPDVGVRWEAVRVVKSLIPSSRGQNNCNKGRMAVNALLNAMAICPICLDEFIVPRITKCGHTFCYSCILRHIHGHNYENQSGCDYPSTINRKKECNTTCPCCFSPLHDEQLRPVVFQSVLAPEKKHFMKFLRLHRTKGCSAPYLPRPGGLRRVSKSCAPVVTDDDAPYCRFNYVDSEWYVDLLCREKYQLDCKLKELSIVDSRSETEYVEIAITTMALEAVKLQIYKAECDAVEEALLTRDQNNSRLKYPIRTFQIKQMQSEICTDIKKHEDEGDFVEPSVIDDFVSNADLQREEKNDKYLKDECFSVTHDNLVYLEEGCFQFYQSYDGQICLLSKFNMNCLSTEFSSSYPGRTTEQEENDGERIQIDTKTKQAVKKKSHSDLPFPDVIEGQIMHVEKTLHLTPDVRKRLPFLSHLPLYTDVQFVELDLTHLLSSETKKTFRKEIEHRRRERKKLFLKEKRADRVAKKKEEERIQNLKAKYPTIDPTDDFFKSALIVDDFGPRLGEPPPPKNIDVRSDRDYSNDERKTDADLENYNSMSHSSSFGKRHQMGGNICLGAMKSTSFASVCKKHQKPNLNNEARFLNKKKVVDDNFPPLPSSPGIVASNNKIQQMSFQQQLQTSTCTNTMSSSEKCATMSLKTSVRCKNKKTGKKEKISLLSTGNHRSY